VLQKLILDGVGPAKHLEVEFAERLNLITGDNGLGKSFLLDVAWWALTGGWPSRDRTAVPRRDADKSELYFAIRGGRDPAIFRFNHSAQIWELPWPRGVPSSPGPVVYAQVDGGFAVWDPARNGSSAGTNPLAPFVFDPKQVWRGLEVERTTRCNGLYRDWASWQREKGEAFLQLQRALKRLSPPGELLTPGPLQRISVDDSLDYPTLQMPYGVAVSLVHASAAIRRILAFAYLLVWTWQEHLRASELLRWDTARSVCLLIDEVDAHLHPSWQRKILPALLDVVAEMTGMEKPPSVQVIATTHSPLVCGSIENENPERNQLLDMDLDAKQGVRLEPVPIEKRGASENWLTSRHFDMKTTLPEKAEAEILRAADLVDRENALTKREFDKQTKALARYLDEFDPYWVRWRAIGEKRGWVK